MLNHSKCKQALDRQLEEIRGIILRVSGRGRGIGIRRSTTVQRRAWYQPSKELGGDFIPASSFAFVAFTIARVTLTKIIHRVVTRFPIDA